MAYTIVVHITNADPVVGEVDQLPTPVDNLVVVNNPRLRDGKDLPYLTENASMVVWPVHRISFIEVATTEGEENIIGFVRE